MTFELADSGKAMTMSTFKSRQLALTALVLLLGSSGISLASATESLVGGVRLEVLPQAWQDESGHAFALTNWPGQRVVMTMSYANCHLICPMTINGLKQMQAALDAKHETAQFVIVGYDPENEDAAAWRNYRKTHHITRSNWHFVTGSVADTVRFASQLKFERWKYDEHVMHDSKVVLFGANGVLSRELGSDTETWAAAL